MSAVQLELCVVGAGPRGVSVLERLCANLTTASGYGSWVRIHVVDAVSDGGGRVWRTTQSELLLMNTVASQVTMFTDDSVDCAGPVVPGPSLYEWAWLLSAETTNVGTYPRSILDEARRLGPDSYPSRALYGHYVTWTLRRVVASAPPGASVELHRALAVALDDNRDGTQTLTFDDGRLLTGLHAVVLVQGHIEVADTETEAALRRYARDNRLCYIPPRNPADASLEGIHPGEPIALRGMGLNFFDYLTLLTTGRGGRFLSQAEGLKYLPSGREPVLYTGSRRGVPYHARGENQKGSCRRHEPKFLTLDVVHALRSRADAGEPLWFLRDVWPLVSNEVRMVYYTALVIREHGRIVGEAFQQKFIDVAGDENVEAGLLDAFAVTDHHRWDWNRITRPWGSKEFADRDDYRAWLLGYLREDVAEAKLGNVRGPLKAGLDVLRDLRNEIRLVVDHGGLIGDSYRDELQGWYNSLNGLVSIGPPARRIEEMVALLEAGILTSLGPGFEVVPADDGSGFLARSAISGPDVKVSTLIEARLPEPDVRRTTDPLLRHLMRTNQCVTYRIPGTNPRVPYETGGLTVTRRPYHVVEVSGRAHQRRFAFGIPTETVHWVTAAGIRPGVNSVILCDADAIARTMIAAAERLAEKQFTLTPANDC
ncbi:FAD/NAD(P)-binding protein [Amycolatopsis speibonae]|uniref:FAD/NAD(P)-binding protein n=1 Tax=Amycolatopsis speibonae TaxID=1450224 RepID=A0ABV7P0J1_9PSEU